MHNSLGVSTRGVMPSYSSWYSAGRRGTVKSHLSCQLAVADSQTPVVLESAAQFLTTKKTVQPLLRTRASGASFDLPLNLRALVIDGRFNL